MMTSGEMGVMILAFSFFKFEDVVDEKEESIEY